MILKYPIGNQDFAGLIEDGYVYVDKTDLVYQLVNESKYVFLSRPRRFGKSLLLSTIRYYFEGRKDLFPGLKIYSLETEWRKHPVLHFSLGTVDFNNPKGLDALLENQFCKWEKKYGIRRIEGPFSERFKNIIIAAREKEREKVVVLVDEYDNPLINTLDDKRLYEYHQKLLKSIYSNLKDMDEFIRFGMLTGVSRFGNMSVFSGLNHLRDITLTDRYSTICGFTESDIKRYLFTGVENLAMVKNISIDDTFALLKLEYDGYHFSKSLEDVYNPFSLLNSLQNREIENYWIRSGVPDFLVKKLNESKIGFTKIFGAHADSYSLAETDSAFEDPVALLFQTGYLTIKSYNPEYEEFILGMPNREVSKGFYLFLLGRYSGLRKPECSIALRKMVHKLEEGNPEEFLTSLKSFLSGISYRLNEKMTELDFERTLFVIFHLIGLDVFTEFETSNGRIDLLIRTHNFIYIIEIKLEGSAEEALNQIKEKEYSLPWEQEGKNIYKIGVNFSKHTRNISSWIIEKNTLKNEQ